MIQTDFDLRAYNTFGLPCRAEQYLRLNQLEQLSAPELHSAPALVLGSGSNLLLLDKIPGLCLHVQLMELLDVTESAAPVKAAYREGEMAILRAGAGINWQQFVIFTLERGLHGLENMALIPGTIGAAPVQNIGAYGAEVAECIERVHVWEYGHGPTILTAAECQFGYRNSLFKREPGRYLITAVDFRLGGSYRPNISYGAVKDRLEKRFPGLPPSPGRVASAVMEIRAEKLPFYSQLGNSGSFFKNPVIPRKHYEQLQSDFPDLPSYPIDDLMVKVPAGWLIDRAGWRGKRKGAVGTYSKQALVIVNHGGATGRDVLAFSEQIQSAVLDRYQIQLEREVRLVGELA